MLDVWLQKASTNSKVTGPSAAGSLGFDQASHSQNIARTVQQSARPAAASYGDSHSNTDHTNVPYLAESDFSWVPDGHNPLLSYQGSSDALDASAGLSGSQQWNWPGDDDLSSFFSAQIFGLGQEGAGEW